MTVTQVKGCSSEELSAATRATAKSFFTKPRRCLKSSAGVPPALLAKYSSELNSARVYEFAEPAGRLRYVTAA
jgi:hypothetical protein